MAEQTIDEIISKEAFDQVERMTRNLKDLADQVAGFSQSTRSAGEGKNFAEWAANSQKANQATEQLTGATQEYITYSIAAHQALKTFGGDVFQNSKLLVENRIRIKEVTKEINAFEKSQLDGVKSTDAHKNRIAELNVELSRLQAANKELGQNIRNSAKEFIAAGGSVNQLRAYLLQLQQTYDNMSVDAKSTGAGKAIKEDIDQISVAVSKAEQATGRFGRNVGNYNSVMVGFNQVLSETPNISQGLALYLRSIGNNVTFLSQAIQEQIRQGKTWKEILKDLRTSLLSFNGIVTIAITVLTLLPEIMKANEKATNGYADALKSAGQEYASTAIQLAAFKAAFNDSTTKMAEKEAMLEEYNRKWGDQAGHLKNVNELEKFLAERSDAFIQVLFLRAKATAALSAATELYTEQLKNTANGGKDLLTFWDKAGTMASKIFGPAGVGKLGEDALGFKRLSENAKETEERVGKLRDQYSKALGEAAALAKANNFDLDGKKNPKDPKIKEPKDLTNIIVDAQKRINDALRVLNGEALQMEQERLSVEADNEENSLQQRLGALQQYINRKQALLDLERDNELKNASLSYGQDIAAIDKSNATKADKIKAFGVLKEAYDAQVLAIGAKFNIKQEELDVEHGKTRVKIIKQNNENILKAQAELVDSRLRMLNDISLGVSETYNEELSALVESLRKGDISYEGYQRRKAELRVKYSALETDGIVSFLENEIALLKAQGVDVEKLEENLTNFKKKQLDKRTENAEKAAEKQMEFEKELQDQIFRSMQATFEYATKFENNRLQKDIEVLELKGKQIEANQEAEILGIQASSATEEEKEKKIAETKSKYHGEELKRQNDINQLKRKQAANEKRAAIMNAVLATAVAMLSHMKLTPPLNYIAMGVDAAIGAAQVASIISTPIPEYAEGIDNHPGGPAIYGEGGQPELVEEPGKPARWVDKPTIGILAAGTSVTPLSDIMTSQMGMLSPQLITSMNVQSENAKMIASLSAINQNLTKELQATQKAINDKPVASFKIDKSGIYGMVQSGNDYQSYRDYHGFNRRNNYKA